MPVTSLTEATISQSITPEQAQTIATNTAGITANANNIATNAAAILTNSQRLDGFASQIEALGTTIASNTEAINDLEDGLAAVRPCQICIYPPERNWRRQAVLPPMATKSALAGP